MSIPPMSVEFMNPEAATAAGTWNTDHKIDRFAIQEVICRLCFTRQSSKTCVFLNIYGRYFSYVCHNRLSSSSSSTNIAFIQTLLLIGINVYIVMFGSENFIAPFVTFGCRKNITPFIASTVGSVAFVAKTKPHINTVISAECVFSKRLFKIITVKRRNIKPTAPFALRICSPVELLSMK